MESFIILLRCSPYHYNLLWPVISYLRSIELRITVFVDDFLLTNIVSHITDSTDQFINNHAVWVSTLSLRNLVFYPIRKQSILSVPYPLCVHGNVIVNSHGNHVIWLKQDIWEILRSSLIYVHALAKGQSTLVAWVVTPDKLFFRNVYRLLGARKSWTNLLNLTTEVHEIFDWGLNSVDYWNLYQICFNSILEQIIIMNAIHLGWEAVYEGSVISMDWNTQVSFQSSYEWEMLAILMAIKAFRTLLESKQVQIFMDNILADICASYGLKESCTIQTSQCNLGRGN